MKKKMMMRHFAAVCLSVFTLIFIGCQDQDYYNPDFSQVGKEPSTLDFSTTQNVMFDFNQDVPAGTVSTFEVYAENPFVKNTVGGWDMRTDLQPIASGIDVAGASELMRTLPDYVNELYVYSPSLFVPTLMHAKINNGTAVFEEVNLNMPITEPEPGTRSYRTGTFDHYLTGKALKKVYEGAGVYYYRPADGYIGKKDFPVSVRNAITRAFPEKKKVDPIYYKDASINIYKDDGSGKGIDLWVSVVSSQCQFNNSLGYFCYDGPKEDLAKMTQAERDGLYITCAFQFAKSSPTMYGALRPGEYIKLKYYNKRTGKHEDKFPVGTTVGWVLSANGFTANSDASNCVTRTRSKDYPWYYSVPSWNPETTNKDHTIIFTAKDGDTDYICFGFEDNNNESAQGDGDCNDMVFHVLTSPGGAIVPPPYIPEEGTTEQTDYKYGYVAFEDNWPRKGDYDLNDVVMKYETYITYVQKTIKENPNDPPKPYGDPFVRRVTDKVSLVHAGADFNNAFAYKVDISPQSLAKITVNNEPFNVVPDGNGFLVELCPNVNDVIVPYEYGTTPKDYYIMMEFHEDLDKYITQDEFNKKEMPAPYNPYIYPVAGREVHLPMYSPTAKAVPSYFGTEDDRSGEGRWYVSGEKNYYPFAIHLSGLKNYVIPVEKQSIDKTYPRYTKWVESGQTLEKDWYLYPKQ